MKTYSKIMDGWFSEICPMWPGVSLSLEIEALLHSEKTQYQQVDLFQTKHHGKMLVLDGIIQLTESDEFAYQEMLAHIPLFAHPKPEKILVIGGGDGGILREAGRHDVIKEIDFCEIDQAVIEVSKKFLPGLACGFDDHRVCVHIEDGVSFVKRKHREYDVIIVDSSDPIGPGEALFKKEFYASVKKALRPGGIVAAQGESVFLHEKYVQDLLRIMKPHFNQISYAWFMVPTYPGGHIGTCIGSLGSSLPREPVRKVPEEMQKHLRYYTSDVHQAAFVLPAFAEKIVEKI